MNHRIKTARYCAVAIAALSLTVASSAFAQVYYCYPGAPAVKKDSPALGVTLGFGHELFRTLGFGRFNINTVSDLGIEIVADNRNDNWMGGVGADYKYNIVPRESTLPFDLAVNGGVGFVTGDNITFVDIPVGGLISHPVELSNGGVLVPYGGVYLIIDYASWSGGNRGEGSDWTTDVELRGGAGYDINATTRAYAGFHLGAGNRFYIGIRFVL